MNTRGGSIVSETQQKIDPGDDDDGEKQDKAEENGPAVVPADDFLQTDDWRRLFVENVPVDTLMKMRLLCKAWRRVADTFIDGRVESVMTVVGENDISLGEAKARRERRLLVMQVVFLLNITKVGDYACYYAVNLVVVEIPEGVESIGDMAFSGCSSLTTVSFPTTLRSIGGFTFVNCYSLENVDLLHTRLQEIGDHAFYDCSELKSMTIPDSLQTLGDFVFANCSNLVPSSIAVHSYYPDKTSEVVAHLRSLQS